MTTPEQRLEMAKSIVDFESRRDSKGRLKVYSLPSGDGGGTYEVAGCNDKYHPKAAADLRKLVEQGRPLEAEALVTSYIADYTDDAAMWSRTPALECYLRDCIWNRGERGAVAILQIAINATGASLTIDGRFGLLTAAALKNALVQSGPRAMLSHLRAAREHYERNKYPWKGGSRAPGNKFWAGLVNRWDGALRVAERYL